MLRHAAIDPKFYMKYQKIKQENLPKLGNLRRILITFLQQKLEKWGNFKEK